MEIEGVDKGLSPLAAHLRRIFLADVNAGLESRKALNSQGKKQDKFAISE